MRFNLFTRPLAFSFIFLFLFLHSHGQTEEIRKLQQQLPAITDSIQYVNTLNKLGLLIHLKRVDSCFYYSKQASAIAGRLHYARGELSAMNNMGIVLCLQGLYSQALSVFGKVLTGYQQQADNAGMSQLYMNMATVYRFLGDSSNAVLFSRRAIATGEHQRNDSLMSSVYANYCEVSPSLPDDSIQYYLRRAEQVATKYHDRRMITVVNQLKAQALLQQGKKEEALPYIRESQAMARNIQLEYLEVSSLGLYADYFGNNIDSAEACYQAIYNIAGTKGYSHLNVRVLKQLLHYAELKRDEKEQLQFSKLLIAAMDEENKDNKSFIGDYVQYYTTQNALNRLEVQNSSNKKKIVLLIGLCIAGALIALVVYRLYRTSRNYIKIQRQLNHKIAEQNESLKQADEFRNKLVSMLTHDFRSPLNGIVSMLRVLQRRDQQQTSNASLQSCYYQLEADVLNIIQVFDNILQWLKKQLSGYTYNPEPLPLNSLMNEAASLFNVMIEEKHIDIRNQISPGIVLQSDREIIQFVNRNLLLNAIKFSPVNGTIILRAETTKKETIVSVEDNGSGMTEDTLKKLFSLNTGDSTYNSQNGAGVALNICRDFITRLNGRMWTESKQTNGSIFYYAIPK